MGEDSKLLNSLQAICRKLDHMLMEKKECAHLVHYLFSRLEEQHPLYQEVHRIVFLLADVRSLIEEARTVAGRLAEIEAQSDWPDED